MTASEPAKNPCGSCPYRQDVPSGVWSTEEYNRLPPYDLPTGVQPVRLFGCHQQDGRLCAGWVGCHDMDENLALRIAVLDGRITTETFEAARDYATEVPLWGSGTEAREHGVNDMHFPSEKAIRTIDRLKAKGLASE